MSIMLCAVAAISIWIAGTQNRVLTEMRGVYHLDTAGLAEGTPPSVVFTTVVLGGFRGLLTDILWIRASILQDQGQYLELVQLADWIVRLEPHSPDVWAFHAWNMAFNVSVMMPRPEDRWRWVRSGVQLLRDEGLLHNPDSPELFCELGWLFQFKIGGKMDQAHLFYKIKWAEEMQNLFNGPHPDYANLGSTPDTLRRMKEEYQLVPEIMAQVESAYGPLDWRLPNTYALYWAWRARTVATDALSSLKSERMLYQGAAAVFLEGRLDFDPGPRTYSVHPRPESYANAVRTFEHALQRHPDESIRTAYMNFLMRAVRVFHELNNDPEARRVHGFMESRFAPLPIPDFEQIISLPDEKPLATPDESR